MNIDVKEWTNKHPVLTFMIAMSAIDGIVGIFKCLTLMITGTRESKSEVVIAETKEEEE